MLQSHQNPIEFLIKSYKLGDFFQLELAKTGAYGTVERSSFQVLKARAFKGMVWDIQDGCDIREECFSKQEIFKRLGILRECRETNLDPGQAPLDP